MTSYQVVPNGDVDVDSSLTEDLLSLLRDNPIAMAEGASDAPYIRTGWHPFDGNLVGGTNDGEVYDHATDGNVTFVQQGMAAGYEYLILVEDLSFSTSADLDFDLRRATDVAWSTTATISVSTANDLYGDIVVPYPDRSRTSFSATSFQGVIFSNGNFAIQPGGGSDVSGVFDATGQTVDAWRLNLSSGNINGGKVYSFRRRSYLSD